MGERRAATAGLPWAAWAPAMARSSLSWVAGPAAALTGSLDRRAAWPPRVRWPGRLTLAAARRAAWTACHRPGPGARRRIEVAVAWRRAPGTRPAAPGHQPPPGTQARCPRRPGRCRPRPPLVRAPCPSRCPRPGSGRDAIPGPAPDDHPVPAAVAPGHRRAEGRDPGRPAPHARATRTWAWYRWPSPALSPPWPGRAVAPDRRAARDRPRSCGDGPSGLGPVRHRLMSGCAVTGAGLTGARFPRLPGARDLTGWPRGIPGAAGMAWPGGCPVSRHLSHRCWIYQRGSC